MGKIGMRKTSAITLLCTLMGFSTFQSTHASEIEKTYAEWTVSKSQESAFTRAFTHGSNVYGHQFGVVTTVPGCQSRLLWISWSAQGPDKPSVAQLEAMELATIALEAGDKITRMEIPLPSAQEFGPDITVFSLTNIPLPPALLDDLRESSEVKVTIEKPKSLAENILHPTDTFSLNGFGRAWNAVDELCAAESQSPPCPGIDISFPTWYDLALGSDAGRSQYLATLAPCLSNNSELTDHVVYLAIEGLIRLADIPEVPRPHWAMLIGEVLRLTAMNGDATSQHNLASMHQAEPGSALATAFPQDQGRFVYWTCMAAAQGEPRALFNLTMQLAHGGIDTTPTSGRPNSETAYLLMHALGPILAPFPQLEVFREALATERPELEKKLGSTKVEALTREAAGFDLTSIAPKGNEPALSASPRSSQ